MFEDLPFFNWHKQPNGVYSFFSIGNCIIDENILNSNGKFMKYLRYTDLRLKLLFVVIIICSLSPLTLSASPIVSRPSLRLGFSVRMPRYSWATLSCHIENPDPRPHNIMLRITSEEGMFQYNVFQDVIHILPKTVIEYKTDFMLENAEKYNIEIFSDGKKLSLPRDDILLKFVKNRGELIGIINDSYDISIGAFTQLKRFKNKYFSSQFQSIQIPENWKTLERFTALVIIDPDYSKISARQYNTLLEYVSMGGIIIFAYPDTLFKLAKTPLAPLLPVHPIKMRHIGRLPAVKKFIHNFGNWRKKPVQFLETIPKKESTVILQNDGLPVFVWKKYGLGSCRFSAIPLCGDYYRNRKDDWQDLLSIFFDHQRFFPEKDEFKACLDEMTGFPIPKSSLIQTLFIIYFASLAILMITGFILKRSGLIWGIAGIYAVIATLFVLRLAQSQSEYTGKLLAAIELDTRNPGPTIPVTGYYGLYSDANVRVSVSAKDENSLISAIPPNANLLMPFAMYQARNRFAKNQPGRNNAASKQQNKSFPITNTYEIQRVNGVPLLSDISIMALTTRQFTCSSAIRDEKLNQFTWPSLLYSQKGLSLDPWQIPQNIKPENAFLLLPSGIFNLTISGNKLTLSSKTQDFFQNNKILKTLRQALCKGYKHSTPSLVLVEKLKKPEIPVPDDTKVQGKKLTVIPLKEKCPEKNILIIPEQIVLSPGDSSTRVIMSGNSLKKNMEINGANSYLFKFQVPPIFSKIRPGKIVVNFSYLNQGGNIKATPYLILNSAEQADSNDPKTKSNSKNPNLFGADAYKNKITGTQIKPGIFVFKGKNIAAALDKVDGKGYILIDTVEKDFKLDAAQKLRTNRWAITKLTIAIKGSIRSPRAPFTY